MPFWHLDATARAAWAAATSQQAQLEGLRDEWAGQMSVHYYSPTDAHLVTVTHETPIVDTSTTPYSLRLGAYVAQTDYSVGVAAYCVLAVPAGADILRADCSLAGPGGEVTNPGGRIRLDIGTTLRVQATSTLPATDTPAWRTAMTDTDKVYAIGDPPSVAEALIDWPATGAENQLYTGTDSNYVYKHYGYGGSVYVPEIGAHGAMIFGGTGEAVFDEQLTSFTLSANTPTWTMFQQPLYATSEAEAISMGASWYYNQAEYDALVISDPDRIVARGAGETDFAASWDAAFPVGYANWIIREKVGESCLGNSRWHSFRFNMPRYIPPAMTGTANGAIIVVNRGPIHGPFSQGQYPAGVTPADWFADVWGDGARKYYVYAMDVMTKAWQRLATPLPNFTGFSTASLPLSCMDESTSRIYYLAGNGSNTATYHIDFSAGLSGMTVSGPTNLTDLAGGPAVSEGANCVFTQNHPTGKRLWYMKEENATPSLLLIDLDANTLRRLSVAGLPSNSAWWSMGYDSANNRVIITTKGAGGVSYYEFTVPSDPTDAANYTISSTTCTFDTGVSLESGKEGSWQYGERGQYLPSLGVVLMTQHTGKMLAYRPG